MTKELSEAEAVQVAAFGLDKEPDFAERMAIAGAKMTSEADRFAAAMTRLMKAFEKSKARS